MVKPEKFGHLHLFYHFTVLLIIPTNIKWVNSVQKVSTHPSIDNPLCYMGNFPFITFLLTSMFDIFFDHIEINIKINYERKLFCHV